MDQKAKRLQSQFKEAQTFRVTGQDLVLNLVDVAVDGGEKLFPAYSQRFHCVLSVTVLEHHRFLNALIELLQFLHVGFVSVHVLLVFLQTDQLIFQSAL